MKNCTWLTFSVLLSLPGLAIAQTRTVTGKVTDAKGSGLPGATIVVRGTTQGTSTTAEGTFSIAVADTAALVFSSVGYNSQTVRVRGQSLLNVTLSDNTQALDEVVVTALNVSRERKTLGYSVTEIAGPSLTVARETNVANSLVGKVAGLNVSSTAGGPGSSSNVIIRGASSINQTNQPLYVINGVPVESQPSGGAGATIGNSGGQYDNAPDFGDPISNLNPDDIETISVLKGAAASALYGYRAKAGVILITTKSAKGNDGIEFNSNYVVQRVFTLTDWQYTYGQGANNIKPTSAATAAQSGNSSWGGRLDGTPVVQFDGTLRPYVAQQDNIRNFYQTGGALTNTIAFNKSFTGGSVRLSASDLANKAVIPNSRLDRQNFNFVGTFDPFKRLTIDARANYILEQAQNRPILSDGAGNANFNAAFLPTSLDVRDLKGPNGDGTQPNGNELIFNTGNTYNTNPYFAAYKFVNNTKRERLLSTVTARYTLDNGLFFQGRVGRDAYNDRITNVTPSGTAYRLLGSITEITNQFTDLNADGLVGKNFKVGENFSFTPNVGASYRRTKQEGFQNFGNDFAVFGVNTLGNTKTKSVLPIFTDLEVQSVYGSLDLAYKEFLFLTGTVRSDWFSSLATPGVDNKLNSVYPGVSGSFVFSELWKPDFLSFGKIRAGFSKVGQATGPYQTQLNYSLSSSTLNGLPFGGPSDPNIPNRALRASQATELEVGTELAFVQNRVRVDLTFYKKNSTGEIVNTPASATSGYSGAVLNAGELENKGVELLLTVLPVKTTDFTWTSSFNAAYNKNTVLSLAAGQQQSVYATSRSGVGFMGQQVGKPFGQVLAYDYQYNTDGSIVLTTNGVPVRGNLTAYGTAFHPWTMGWTNDFAYKRFNLGVLIDGKFGGKIFSTTDYYATIYGLRKETLVGREGTFGPDKLDAATYYGTLANNVSNQFVQDASFIKLRQVTLGYSFPTALFNNKVRSLTLSLVARNLFFLRRLTDNIDPEGSYNAFSQGLELGGVPPSRTYGLNLNAKF
ncbi:SusC/RagA family TonB-linked outer membrane protein [Hymenobacter sp. UV11]|uniref:SusC/RagA family TonB-linked outer membrane protein n=1 Tax=Hymenobacter sp. UV11 TaxID=1849735 RepID=UPI00105F44B5|nr:SusC/RagA family TonB-linked outer membrane protein [Hymenobacter sp. UV11]TDN38711.1 SusC/RagA family TonB-linked outer membrane protein [Hymenobacter sp. UV11]TFZ63466.1 SusC/RagA family TonB-linked outer membrane protein [Hymenobacter sp. UV11]